MSDVRPFRGFRPKTEYVNEIASPPYDVLNSAEAREMAKGNALSFLHVVKPEIDLPEGTDQYSDIVYATGAKNLARLIDEGYLVRDDRPCYYVYQQRMGQHTQVGIVAAMSVDEYERDLIKKHEHTRKDKEDDRTRHVQELNANAGPVFLTYKARADIDAMVETIRAGAPTYDFIADDGIGHTLWVVDDRAIIDRLQAAFAEVPAMYVADGHHRSASAARVGKLRREANPQHTGREAYNHFLAVAFPDNQLKILDYNRVVKDLNGLSPDAFLARVKEKYEIIPCATPPPKCMRHVGMYVGKKRWWRLIAKEGSFPADDPVASLDVQILWENLLHPVLGIGDPRTDKRIDFVGGIRGIKELERLVDSGAYAVAFAMFPTTIDQLMAIADANMVMPPKSTWFEPKLRSGIVVRLLIDD
ncbi:MAG TPA: DUF1015 family protein [bacterium]|nr:DUF1015 family protein [bacterium]